MEATKCIDGSILLFKTSVEIHKSQIELTLAQSIAQGRCN